MNKKETAKLRILRHLRTNPGQNREGLTLATMTKTSTLSRALQELVSEGKILRERGRYWRTPQ